MSKKLVQIILIILCAITILAGCSNVQPQDEVAPTPDNTEEALPQDASDDSDASQSNTVTISINCSKATEAEIAGASEDGWIMEAIEVELQEGDTVWTVLDRVSRERGIAVAKNGSGATVFVKSIAGISAISADSGWMFSLNGTYIMTSAGGCKLEAGDIVCWEYTMDGGADF